ncbi:MAG: hypothetical protein HOU81_01980 [Hamadaea sp.]|uniref:hypothetical protein n=1 Tax=Hamadaea sp. TaxID=2024425 RepID=UPI0017DF122A|nr:hypothetical protein [Hamadaea sp.]NUR69567.1 hypothetical protein [Hamadaea sp.]NUT19454.1 hypothetical protein [Hamadaea sp.]
MSDDYRPDDEAEATTELMGDGGSASSEASRPMTGAWQEYLAAAERLDAVRREAAAGVAAEQAALRAAREELPPIRARLALQQQRMSEMATMSGRQMPVLTPNPAETTSAERAVTGGPAVVLAALRQALSTVDVADGALAQAPTRPPSATNKNLGVYGGLAAVALLAQIAFVLLVDERTRPLYAGCTGFLLGFGAFGIGWIATGVISRTRTAALGLAVVALPLLLSTAVFTLLWIMR